MQITLRAALKDGKGKLLVTNENGKTLMDDTAEYVNMDAFLDVIAKKFRYNPRFEWVEAVYHTKTDTFEIKMNDKGRRIK